MEKIEMGGVYKTKDGQDVRILCIDASQVAPVIALVDGLPIRYTATGEHVGRFDELDLVDANPFKGIELDAKVWVTDIGTPQWYPRHYAGFTSDGRIIAWKGGRTSFACGFENLQTEPDKQECFAWDKWKLAE